VVTRRFLWHDRARKAGFLKESKFGLPEERKYPMPDEAHARNAKARAAQNRMVALPSLRHTSPATTGSTSTAQTLARSERA
jgi:hypothetical protein